MNRRLMLLAPLALAACGTVADKAADQLLEAGTPAERTLRLKGATVILSELFAERAESEPGKARSLLFALEEVQDAIGSLKPDDLFFNTKVDQALDPIAGALGAGLKGRLVQIVKAAAGSRGSQFGLALDALQAGRRVGAMIEDLRQAMADVASGKRQQNDVEQIIGAATKRNVDFLRRQARGRR